MSGTMTDTAPTRQLTTMQKLAIDYGPLAVFFLANFAGGRFAPGQGIFIATGAVMVATVLAAAASYTLVHRVPPMLLFTLVIVAVMGGLTLWLHDAEFIKRKPTLLYGLFAAVLLFGLATGRPLLRAVLGTSVDLTDAGWRRLTVNWALLFVGLALLNEIAWRTLTTDRWVQFKVFGVTGIIFLFALAQAPLLLKHERK